MGFDTIIANGKVVTATDTYLADIAISAGKIEVVGQNLPRQNAARVLEAMGKYVFPGGIDVHTHLDMPFGGTTSADDFETGTRAAAFGGTTSIVDFAIQARGTRMRDALDTWWKKAEGKACIDYGLHMIVTAPGNSGREDMDDRVNEARDRGVPAFAETCPQYLLLSIEELERPNFEGAKYVFTPPLRTKENLPKLWDGLKHDHLQVVSTDHCPFCFEDQKILGKDDFTKIPNGGPGIENRLQLMHHYGVGAGKISLNRFVEIVSTAPAKIFGMYPKKGTLATGSDADIVVWDPKAEYTISAKTHNMRVDYSMFE